MTESDFLTRLERDLDKLRAAGANWELAATKPKLVLLIKWDDCWDSMFRSAPFLMGNLNDLLLGSMARSIKRCVGLERLPMILQHGVDVFPTNSVIWADTTAGKALEYGGDEKVMMLFNEDHTKPAYRTIPATTPQNELEELRILYPTINPSADGSTLSLSRLPKNDTRTANYDIFFGRWIPGDPFEALAGLVLFGRDLQKMICFVAESIAACPHPKWL